MPAEHGIRLLPLGEPALLDEPSLPGGEWLCRVWFTVSKGIVNEVYYPTIDRPRIRDLQYLITDGETFFHDERHLDNTREYLAPDTLGFRITNVDPRRRYRITKEVITDPHQACVLVYA